MICEIENNTLKIKVNTVGAELVSVVDKKSDSELLWQGNEKYWKGQSPIMFPFCGRLFNKKYEYKGKQYEINLHGFARHLEFSLLKKENNFISFKLSENDETLKIYPFKFNLIVTYNLDGEKLTVNYKVENTNDSAMYFSIGGHPGFNVPFEKNKKFEDYHIEITHDSLRRRTFTENYLYSGKTVEFKFKNKAVDLRHNLFDDDAIFLELINRKETFKLQSNGSKSFIKMEVNDAAAVGFWHAPKTDAPYVCIEPWCGFPGRDNKLENLETMGDVNKIERGGEYNNFYSITFHIE